MSDLGSLRIYAIVVTFNGDRWINNCILSLVRSSLPVNIIVVDNASHDNTCKIIDDKFKGVQLIKLEKNIGFGKANNIGLEEAKRNNADYIILLNQDAWVESNTLEILVNISIRYPFYGILSGLHLDGKAEELDLNFSKQFTAEKCPYFLSDLLLNKSKEIYEIEFIPAAFWLIPKPCFEKVGLFEPLFDIYGEDCNYIQRANYHNYKVGVTSMTSICHDRKNRGGAKSVNVNEDYLDFMISVLNPNRTFLITYLKGTMRIAFNSFLYFIKLNLKNSFYSILLLLRTLGYCRKYIRARRSY